MDIHEYQAKELLTGFGVRVPKGGVAYSADQAVYRAAEIGGNGWVVKAQIHSGARGKAGGIKLCATDVDVRQAAKELLGKSLVTTQTGPEGLPVHRLLVEEALPIARELYVGFVLDRKRERIVVVAHPHGGMEIEEIAQREPEAILREVVEPAVGMQAFQARELAMATMDMIKHAGGEPANFLDIGGGASPERVAAAFRLVLSDKKVRAILVNVFAGINRCDWVAQGVVQAVREVQVPVPLVVRLAGTNVEEGRRILRESGLPILTADTLSEAAEKVVVARRTESATTTKPA